MSRPKNGFTDKEAVFIEEYLQRWNATEAARRAGYAHPMQESNVVLQRPRVREIIQQRLREKAMGADEVLARLDDIARGDIAEFITPSGRGFRIDIKKGFEAGKSYLVKKLSKNRKGTEIELYDAMKALELLGKNHKLFTDVQEHQGQVMQVEMTLAEWQANQAQRQKQVDETITVFEGSDG